MTNAPTTRETADHAELARLAEAATSGPWYLRTNRHTATNGNQWGWLDSCPPGARQLAPEGVSVTWEEGRESHSNARFIAAANPATVLALLSEIAALRGEVDVLEVEKIGLRAAIFGSHDYDPSLRHGNFIEMARHTEEARKGALSRATQAERQRDELRRALEEIADEAPYRSGYCQSDVEYGPALSADEMQAVARQALANQGAE